MHYSSFYSSYIQLTNIISAGYPKKMCILSEKLKNRTHFKCSPICVTCHNTVILLCNALLTSVQEEVYRRC